MAIECVSQVLHDALADDRVEIGLPYPNESRDDRKCDHQPDVEVETVQVSIRDGVVDDFLEQEGVGQANDCDGNDRHHSQGHTQDVRSEELQYAPYRLSRDGTPL